MGYWDHIDSNMDAFSDCDQELPSEGNIGRNMCVCARVHARYGDVDGMKHEFKTQRYTVTNNLCVVT